MNRTNQGSVPQLPQHESNKQRKKYLHRINALARACRNFLNPRRSLN
jgi:hypothetical protein